MQCLVFEKFGPPDVLFTLSRPTPRPLEGELLVAVTAAGLNFADIYRRQGRYRLAGASPYIAGYEGAGRVAAVGRGVAGWKVGDRIGFADVPLAHASHVLVPATHAIRLPDWLSETDAAAILLQGLTADYLVHDLLPIGAGMHIAVLAAAGGVGKLLSAMLIQRGVLVLAVASSAEKRALCLELGVQAVAPYENWPAKAREWGPGGCDVVFDSLGSTVPQSLGVLRPGGRVVLYGMAGGDIPVIDPATLLPRSIGIIGADLWTWLSSPAERQRRADRLFSALDNGIIKLPVIKQYALSAGIEAHRQLEQRDFSGKILLVP